MRTIVKCVLPFQHGPFSLLLPRDADFIYCGKDELDAALFFIADNDDAVEKFEVPFYLALAGRELPTWCASKTHVASIHARWLTRGWVLLHIFRGVVGEANALGE